MKTNQDIPYEFRASIFRDYVRIVTANAIISAQYVEKVLNGICFFAGGSGLRFSAEDLLSGDSARTRQTLGMIAKQLRKTNLFEMSFSERLSHFINRRNRIVHGLFADSFNSHDEINLESQKAREYVKECEWVADEGAQLVEVGIGIFRVLGDVALAKNPDHHQLEEILRALDEFYEVGLGSIASKFRPHFASKKW